MASDVDPAPVAHVMVRRRLGDGVRELGAEASIAVSALEQSGRPFPNGRTVLVLEPHDGIEEIQNLLARSPVSTLGVASLRTLGDSQIEAMQSLLFLTNDGWRVVSARDTHAWTRSESDEWYADEYSWPSEDRAAPDLGGVGNGRLIEATHRFTSNW